MNTTYLLYKSGNEWQIERLDRRENVRSFPTAAEARKWAKANGGSIVRDLNCDQ
jgi:hypothetical protein